MAGLTPEGFTPLSLEEIKDRIKSKLETFSPGIDLSVESPDGQFVEIFSYELSQAWNELNFVYKSYDPQQAAGAGLRNLGLITGIVFGAATRSQAYVQLVGIAGTPIPAGSLVADAEDNSFQLMYDAVIPATVLAVSPIAGIIPVPAGTLVNIKSPITGWTGVTQTAEGDEGTTAQTEAAFRNIRNKTVLRNYTSNVDVIQARLLELGLSQVSVVHNDDPVAALPDGTPANQIHVTISEEGIITDEEIARIILQTKPAGISTYGTTAVVLDDLQGNSHTVNFTKAVGVNIYMNVDVTYLDEDTAGAEESIISALVSHINGLQVGEDVIHSRLFCLITPYGKAQVDVLELGVSTGITGSIDATASTAVVGVGTLFNTELAIGDRLIVSGEVRKVDSITDNLNLTVDAAFTDTANDTSPEKVSATAANIAIAATEFAYCETAFIDFKVT